MKDFHGMVVITLSCWNVIEIDGNLVYKFSVQLVFFVFLLLQWLEGFGGTSSMSFPAVVST